MFFASGGSTLREHGRGLRTVNAVLLLAILVLVVLTGVLFAGLAGPKPLQSVTGGIVYSQRPIFFFDLYNNMGTSQTYTFVVSLSGSNPPKEGATTISVLGHRTYSYVLYLPVNLTRTYSINVVIYKGNYTFSSMQVFNETWYTH